MAEPTDLEEWGPFTGVTVTSDGRVFVQEGDYLLKILTDGELQPVDDVYRPGADLAADLGVPLPFEGPDGSLWFSTGDWGDRAVVGRVLGDQLTTLDISGEGPGGLLGFASDGSIWFSTEFWGPTNNISDDIGALLRYDGEAWMSYDLGGVGTAVFLEDGTAWFTVGEITGESLLWENQYSEPGVYSFDGAEWRHFTTRDWLPGLDLSGVARAPDGSLWFTTATNGVVHHTPGTVIGTGTPVEVAGEPLIEWPDNATTTAPAP
jgi:hypothetical protein